MVGAIVASAILDGLTPGPLNTGVALGQGTNRTQGLFIEMFTTATLVMSVLMLAAGMLDLFSSTFTLLVETCTLCLDDREVVVLPIPTSVSGIY